MHTEGRWASVLSLYGGLAGMVAVAALWSTWGYWVIRGDGLELLVIIPLAWWLHARLGREIGRRLDRVGEVDGDSTVTRLPFGRVRSFASPGASRRSGLGAPRRQGHRRRSFGRPHRESPWWLQRSDYDWDRFHEQVLRETFRSVSLREAVILVGLLYTCQVHLSRELKDLAVKANQWTPAHVQPAALHEAISIVSIVYGQSRGLREAFARDWVTLRESQHARDVRDRIEGHRFVGALVRADPL